MPLKMIQNQSLREKDGLAVMKTLDAIYLSNSEERWVDLAEVEIETDLTSRERK
ncbi:hypothetical protein GCM10020331_102210 [Ectobacillus funiculus]